MKVRRVGSITCGSLMILFGVLFMAHMIVPAITFGFIFRLWPIILIALGVEILLSNRKKIKDCEIKYDMGAIALVIILAFFAMGMGFMEYCFNNAPESYFYIGSR